MTARLALLWITALTASGLTGCFGATPASDDTFEPLEVPAVSQETEAQLQELVQAVPSNYTFPLQKALDPVLVWINDTVGSEANTAIESPQDEGGIDFQPVIKATDITPYLPVGQAAEIHITLRWWGNPGASSDLDIFVDVPGTTTDYDPGQDQQMNWNIPVKRRVVDTVGVEGYPARIGVQATNGLIAPGSTVPYALKLEFDYVQDVLTPYHPYAFQLPEGAGGVVLRSVKAGGNEHVRAAFLILDPKDGRAAYLEYDDIAITTESVFVPLRQPGEHVFFAYHMTGGFLSLKADTPVPARMVRSLPRVEASMVDFSQPLAPGVPAIDLGVAQTPYSATQTPGFTLDTHPLRVTGWMSKDSVVTGAAQLRILGPAGGIVYDQVRAGRVDLGAQGSLGWTGDHAPFVHEDPSQLGKGAYGVEVVADLFTGEMGHTTLTYQRSPQTAPSGGA